MNPLLTKSRETAGVLAPYSLATFSGSGSKVVQASAASQVAAGVVDSMGAASGGMADLHLAGLAEVRAGGTFAAGDPLTSDASGLAIKAVKQAGATVVVHAIAQAPAVQGDIVPALVAPSLIVG